MTRIVETKRKRAQKWDEANREKSIEVLNCFNM